MKKIVGLLSIVALVVFVTPVEAYATKPNAPSGNDGTKLQPSLEYVGYDVSYPQCGKNLPTNHYFGIVGINGGNAVTVNPCLADQLVWQSRAKPGSNQPALQVYVNTANPAQDSSYSWTSWPKTAYDANGNVPNNPYGSSCNGQNDQACSWLYGWNRSIYTESLLKSAAISKGLNENTADYVWWLDVETMNSWQSGSPEALQRNVAAIEGFGAYYQSKGARIGLYSTSLQWSEITGNFISSMSNLNGLPNWRPSGRSLSNAKANCALKPLTPNGSIALTQYVVKNLDHNHSCL